VTYAAPMELLLEGRPFGRIETYDYDQPWAMGLLQPIDVGAHRRMIELCELMQEIESWPDAPLEEDDRRWRAALEARGLTDPDVDAYDSGPWVVRTADGELHPVWRPEFDRRGFLTWRW
jgi:hypothetical protein